MIVLIKRKNIVFFLVKGFGFFMFFFKGKRDGSKIFG